ncbi:MAG: hypothetical protein ABFD94_00270, partial [Armatimonadia bacterium]
DPGWDLTKTPLWAQMKQLNEETLRMGTLVTTGEPLPPVVVDSKDVQAAAWRLAGQTQILVTNPTPTPQTATLKLAREVTICKRLHGDGEAQVVDRVVKVTLPGYGSSTLLAQ